MAKTALLAQNEALEARTLNPNVKKSMIPLSHTVQYPVDVEGAILPCCCVEVVPTDSYKISNQILLRQLQPLKVPQMTRYTLNTAYFYCSNRLGWKKWPMFADQANRGRPDNNYSFDLPRLESNDYSLADLTVRHVLLDKNEITGDRGESFKNCLHTYFNISMGWTASGTSGSKVFKNHGTTVNLEDFPEDDLPLAFPFFDYQIICRDFYTNIDRLPDEYDNSNFTKYDNPFSDWAFNNLFPVDDDEIRLVDGLQSKSGMNTGDDSDTSSKKGFMLDKVRYHDLRADYFTSSKRAPMRGEAPTVDTTLAVTSIDASDIIQGAGMPDAKDNYLLSVSTSNKLMAINAVSQSVDLHGAAGEWETTGSSDNWTTDKLDAGNSQNYNYSGVRARVKDTTATAALKAALEGLKVNIQTTKAINCANLMLLSQLTLWQTLNMLAKPTYNDFLNAHFENTRVGDSLAEKPMYIGGTSQTIDINEVLQTSADSGDQKLGNQAAVAHSLSGSFVGQFFAPDYGFIIGVMYIIPDVVYDPAMPRWASRRQIEDYYFPEFANLSMQATLNKELFFSSDSDWNNAALGYVGAYDELRAIPNYCAGLMLDSNYSDLGKWLVRRSFSNDNKPAINQRFLSAKGNVDKSAWTLPNEPKFMFQCANYIEAARPMPWLAVPMLK